MQSAAIFHNTTVIRCGLMRLVTVLSLMLTTLPAVAVDYVFSATSNSFPMSCAYASVGNYTCANLLLVAGDTITMEPSVPATPANINVAGTFIMSGASVNTGGLSSNLNIAAVGTVTIGTALLTTDTQVNANVSSIAAINVYDSSIIRGNLWANTTTGIISLATNIHVLGDIYTDAGAITLGIGTHVDSNVFSTGAGVLSFGAGVTVDGDVHTAAGGITLGIGSVVGGQVFSTGAGVITLESEVSVDDSLSSFDGAINVGIGSQVGGGVSSSGGGILTLGANVIVGLDVISAVGAVVVGNGSSIGGDAGSTGAGVVTLGSNITVGGEIFTVDGAINIGDSTTVVGSVSSSGAGVLTLTTNVVVGGSVTSTVGAVDVGGGSTICGDAGSFGDGVITLTTNVGVGGGVFSNAGAITIGGGSTVQLSVIIEGVGVMTLTSVEVGGDLYTAVGTITGTTSRVRGHITASNIHGDTPTDLTWSHQTDLVVSEPAGCIALFPPPPLPDILVLKSVQVYSDPVNLQDNPKAIPGAVMLYTILVTNQGGATDSDTMVITDPMPVNTEVFVNDINGVGSGLLLFTDGTTVSGLSYSMNSLASTTDNISFSNDNGASFVYNPIPSTGGYDSAVTDIKVSLSGSFKASTGAPHPSFSIRFRVRLQ
jgi:hypothetical protein